RIVKIPQTDTCSDEKHWVVAILAYKFPDIHVTPSDKSEHSILTAWQINHVDKYIWAKIVQKLSLTLRP
ncbi:TPA: hypothetical protein ACHJ1O_001557, partial [Escherichia coli]